MSIVRFNCTPNTWPVSQPGRERPRVTSLIMILVALLSFAWCSWCHEKLDKYGCCESRTVNSHLARCPRLIRVARFTTAAAAAGHCCFYEEFPGSFRPFRKQPNNRGSKWKLSTLPLYSSSTPASKEGREGLIAMACINDPSLSSYRAEILVLIKRQTNRNTPHSSVKVCFKGWSMFARPRTQLNGRRVLQVGGGLVSALFFWLVACLLECLFVCSFFLFSKHRAPLFSPF